MDDKRLLVLDRDGVINRDSADFIKTPDEWQPLPRSLDAIARLTQGGFTIAVATNQSGLARGLFDVNTLKSIHDRMLDAIREAGGDIALIRYCPHGPDDDCECRKPKPGLLYDIAARLNTPLSGVPVVGDSLRDLEAAAAAGAAPILVRTGNGEKTAASLPLELADTPVCDDLAAVADALLGRAA